MPGTLASTSTQRRQLRSMSSCRSIWVCGGGGKRHMQTCQATVYVRASVSSCLRRSGQLDGEGQVCRHMFPVPHAGQLGLQGAHDGRWEVAAACKPKAGYSNLVQGPRHCTVKPLATSLRPTAPDPHTCSHHSHFCLHRVPRTPQPTLSLPLDPALYPLCPAPRSPPPA